jgi:hypothetical protein
MRWALMGLCGLRAGWKACITLLLAHGQLTQAFWA